MTDTLWYDSPATKWQEGLPIGNGRIGAVVLSAIDQETWSFTDITFWSGQAESSPPGSYGGREALDKVRSRYFENDYVGGKRLAEQYLQPAKGNYGTNLIVARVRLDFEHQRRDFSSSSSSSDFTRSLNLDEAIACASYQVNGHSYHRESWVSHPQQVLVSQLRTDAPEGISVEISIEGETAEFTVSSGDDHLVFDTRAVESVHSNGKCGVSGRGVIQVTTSGGSVRSADGRITIKNASVVTIKVAFNTDFRQKDDKWKVLAWEQLKETEKKPYEQLRDEHLRDHQSLYRRVTIDLGQNTERSKWPVDKRRAQFKASGYDDPGLFALFFQYGRYLTITGTRADSPLPLHLQGLWNDGEANRMNWSCDYHLDINIQMNYFPTETANLSDLQAPLMKYIEYLAEAGRTTANQSYGCPGWVAHVFSNVWGFTDPGWETSWGLNVTGGLWMATHMIEHYEYTLDRTFLAQEAYPVLRAAAEFFLAYMTVDSRTGYLVTGPSVSPENSFFPSSPGSASGGERTEQHLSLAPTVDIILVRDLFRFCIYAARELDIDDKLIHSLEDALPKLPPFKIGQRGQLQEWLEDYDEAQPDHRHLSHTMALCRSDQISLRHTPELAQATRATLDQRQARADLEDIEFTAALLGLNYARLNEPEQSFRQLGHLIGELAFDNLLTYSKPGIAGAETNIFIADGNYGGTAVLAEMLLRSAVSSNNDSKNSGGEGFQIEIDLLPALPSSAWPAGRIHGLRARGNIEVDIQWEGGKLTKARLTSYSGRSLGVSVYYGEHSRRVSLPAKGVVQLDGLLRVV
ncbi:hypothetical protein VTN77DRAFT_2211 [Rasamsonia byssochlamydoides]|uniref:uncharacterized protein n=1 Tax=Rasamsonia byssochlamydoides TaxID=89139 RepID=UPI0037420889